MAVHSFIPWAEQLESKLLLAVLHPAHAEEAVNPTPVLPAAEHSEPDAPVDHSGVVFRTERQGNEYVLVIQLGNTELPQMVSLLGGDARMTQEDGIARLRLPSDDRSIQLTISDESGEHSSLVRLEVSDDGQIMSYRWLDPTVPNGEQGKSSLVIASDHSAGSHSAGAANLLFAKVDDWSHEPGMALDHSDRMTGRAVDEAIAHDYRMTGMSADAPHAESSADFSRGEHAADTPIPPTAAATGETESTPEHAAPAGAQAVVVPITLVQESAAIPAQGDESFETVVAGWTTGPDSVTIPVTRIEPVYPSPIRGVETMDLAADAQLTMGPIVFASLVTEVAPDMQPVDDVEASSWPVVGAVFVSAAAAAGAFALERRNARSSRPTERGEHELL